VTAEKPVLAEISALAEANPEAEAVLDVTAQTLTLAGKTFAVQSPASAREALVNGRWDAIADLLEGAPEVAEVAKRLGYV